MTILKSERSAQGIARNEFMCKMNFEFRIQMQNSNEATMRMADCPSGKIPNENIKIAVFAKGNNLVLPLQKNAIINLRIYKSLVDINPDSLLDGGVGPELETEPEKIHANPKSAENDLFID